MADEIQVTVGMKIANGKFKLTLPAETVSITQAAIGTWEAVVSVGTSEEDMAPVDITTLGVLWLKNLDATNYVQYGPKSAGVMVAIGRIKPGEIHTLRLEPGITIRWIANTAAVKVQAKLLEN